MRTFDTGATRDSDESKPNYNGFLSPLVLERFGRYMLSHQVQADGKRREADNWKKGIPNKAYMESAFRHYMELWLIFEGHRKGDAEEALCALMFNVMGMMHQVVKARLVVVPPTVLVD